MIKSVKPIMMEEDHGLLTPGCIVEMQNTISEKSKKLYLAWYDDFTIGNLGTHLLGIYDSKEAAEQRADEYFKKYIKSDTCGPLGNTWVTECTLNEKLPGSAIEAACMEEEKNG